MASLVFLASLVLMVLLAYPILPDSTPNANRMHISMTLKNMGHEATFLQLHENEEVDVMTKWWKGTPEIAEEIPIDTHFFFNDTLFFSQPNAPVQGVHLSPELHSHIQKGHYLIKRKFWLGTDRFGRDMLSRLMLGTRVSLSVGLLAVGISLLIGVTLGLLGGYFGGWVDKVVMWFINVVWSLPTLLIVIALSMALGKGYWQVFVAVGLSMWVELARIVRGQVKSVKELEYVQAAKIMGFSNLRIMFGHILPNISGPIIVVCAANFASAILLEAGLSFLGLGVQPPMPSWGMMIKEHYGYIVFDAAHLAIFPGLAIMLTVMAFNFVGNGLRDALDVH